MNTKTKKATRNNLLIGSGVTLAAIAAAILANKLWTDHNAHDPGVTELEVLAYLGEDKNDDAANRRTRKKKPK